MVRSALVQDYSVSRGRQWKGMALPIVLLLAVLPPVHGQTTTSPAAPTSAPSETQIVAPTDSRALTPIIMPPPTTDEGIAERIQKGSVYVEEMKPATQPSTSSAPAPGETEFKQAMMDLYEVGSTYIAELTQWQAARARIKELSGGPAIEAASKEVADWEAATKTYHGKALPKWRFLIDHELDEVEQQFNQWNSRFVLLTNVQAGRETQLNNLLAQKERVEQTARTTYDALQALLQKMPTQLDAAKSQYERDTLQARKRALEWKHNLALLRAAVIPDQRTLLDLQTRQDALRVRALDALVEALRAYRSRLQTERSKSESQFASEQLTRPDLLPYERVYWEAKLVAAQANQGFQVFEQAAQKRFTTQDADALANRVQEAEVYWRRFVDSLKRRPGESILAGYARVRQQYAEARQELDTLQARLDATYEEQRSAIEQRDELRDKTALAMQRLDELIRALEGDEQTEGRKRQAALIAETINPLKERIETILTDQNKLIERLTDSISKLDTHAQNLARYRARIYWVHLIVPGRGVLSQDWPAARAEWRSLWTGQGEAFAQWRRELTTTRDRVGRVAAANWASSVLLILLTMWVALRTRSWLLHRVAVHEEVERAVVQEGEIDGTTEAKEAASVSERGHQVQRHVLWIFAVTAPVVWPLVAVMLALLSFRIATPLSFGILVLLSASAAAVIGLATIEALVGGDGPANRIISCADPAARYHRRWLRVLLIVAWLLVPIPLALDTAGVLPKILEVAWHVAKLILLLVLLVYLLRQRYFRPAAVAEQQLGWETRLYVRLFPLFPAVVGLMIVLDAGGYAALSDYLLRGLAVSFVVLSTAKFLRRWIDAWMAVQPSLAAGVAESGAASAAPSEIPRKTSPLVLSLVQLIRIGLIAGPVVAVLVGWGVSLVEIDALLDARLGTLNDRPVTAWRVLGALLAVAVAVAVSRSVRSFLQTQVFPRARHLDLGAQAAISTILNYVIIAIGCYVALTTVHLDLGALTVLLGTLGLGLGLGLQPLAINFISGLMILFERQIKIGDIVIVDNELGKVTSIRMRSTTIQTPDNVELVVPNGDFVTGRVTNWTLSDHKLRARVRVGVAYGSDVDVVRKILLDIAHRHSSVLVDPLPQVWFMNFGDNSLDFELVCWFANADTRWQFMSQVRFEMAKQFAEHKIGIPFPQRTISFLNDKPIPVKMVAQEESTELPMEEDVQKPASGETGSQTSVKPK